MEAVKDMAYATDETMNSVIENPLDEGNFRG
jgi:hypothetical protein